VSSDLSSGQCSSETSLGEQITAMAQDPQPAELLHTLPLEPGLRSKPLLPQYSMQTNDSIQALVHSRDKYFDNSVNYEDSLFEKFNYGCSLTDEPYYLNQSAHSGDKYMLVSGEPEGDNSHTCSTIPMIFPDKSERGLVNNVPDDKIITQQCSSVKDEILVNTEGPSQCVSEPHPAEKRQDFNEQRQNLFELKCQPFTQNLKCNVNYGVSSDLRGIKVQHCFSDSVSKDNKVPNSVMCQMERQIDILHTNLVREQSNNDCSDSCQDLGITVGHEGDINRVHTGKPRRQELYFERLVDEDIDEYGGSSSIKSSGNDKKCSLSNSNHHNVNVEKEGEICHMEMKITGSSFLPSQRTGDKADTLPQEMLPVCGDFEG
jgi:hypothetical protein